MHSEGDVCWLQQHILVRFIVRENMVPISEVERIMLRRLANQETGIVRSDSTILVLNNTILNFSIAFEE